MAPLEPVAELDLGVLNLDAEHPFQTLRPAHRDVIKVRTALLGQVRRARACWNCCRKTYEIRIRRFKPSP
jgi:hypothetical protein